MACVRVQFSKKTHGDGAGIVRKLDANRKRIPATCEPLNPPENAQNTPRTRFSLRPFPRTPKTAQNDVRFVGLVRIVTMIELVIQNRVFLGSQNKRHEKHDRPALW